MSYIPKAKKSKSGGKRPTWATAAIVAGLTAAAVASGVTLARYVKARGGWAAIKSGIQTGFEAGGVTGAITGGLAVVVAPTMTAGVTAPVQPAQAAQLFETIKNIIIPEMAPPPWMGVDDQQALERIYGSISSNLNYSINGDVYNEYGERQL